jgi:molybdate transport system substrate-binding protein
MKLIWIRLAGVLPVLALAASGCRSAGLNGAAAPASTALGSQLSVFAAASLTDAFSELGTLFTAAHPGVTVSINFAGSSQLEQQLAQGAAGDVFASAGPAPMAALEAGGQVAEGAALVFATNQLVVIVPAGNPGGLTALADLARPGLRVVLAAPEVPAGQYSAQFLAQAATDPALGPDFAAGVLDNVASYETSVRAVLSKVSLGEADAGIVYTSDAASQSGQAVGQIAIPDQVNVTATYPIAVLSDSQNPTAAQSFVNLVLGATGQAVLARHGFQGAP